MKVLHIINSPGLGGAETMVKDIASHFTSHLIFCLRKDEKNRFAKFGDRVTYGVDQFQNYKYSATVLFKLISSIKKESPDIIHVHLANSLVYGLLIGFLYPKVKLIYHEHGELVGGNKKLSFLLSILGKKISLTIAVSDYVQTALLSCNKTINTVVIKNYTDIKYFSKIDKNSNAKIGFIGRLAPIKGCSTLVRVLAMLQNRCGVVIYGDGPEKQMLIDLAESLKVSERIVFMGYESDRRKIFSNISIVVIPSIMEAASLVCLEARAAGCIVVASRVGGLPEYLEDKVTGFLFEKENHTQIASILDELIQNSKLRDVIRQQSLHDIQKYDISLYMSTLDKLYSKYDG